MNHITAPSFEKMKQAALYYKLFLEELGIWDIMEAEPKSRTPMRVVQSYLEFFGNNLAPINFTTFPTDSHQMVSVLNISFAALCAHHHLPFVGKCHVGYIPDGLVPGLSKVARVVEHFTHGALIQEEVTDNIANYLQTMLQPKGVIVVMQAEHSCMTVRGVRKPGSETLTVAKRGVFEASFDDCSQFLELISINRQ
jgi:GTP cyclohydrolase I